MRSLADAACANTPEKQNKGFAKLNLGCYEEALELSFEAYRLDSKLTVGLNNAAHILSELGRYQESLEWHDRLIAVEPSSRAWSNKARVLESLGRLDEALDCLDKSLRLGVTSVALINRGRCLQALDRDEEARESFVRCSKHEPSLGLAKVYIGYLEIKSHNYKPAMLAFDSILKSSPRDISALYAKAQLLYKVGSPELGDGYFDTFIQELNANVHKDTIAYNIQMGMISFLREKHEQALQHYERVLAVNARQCDALYNKGTMLLMQGKFEEGMKLYEECLGVNPKYTDRFTQEKLVDIYNSWKPKNTGNKPH
jgi:tetratricopeptide (TPR) repeat protein